MKPKTNAQLQAENAALRARLAVLEAKRAEWPQPDTALTAELRAANIRLQQEISEREQAQQNFQSSEERFRVAQELSLDGFTILRSIRNEQGTIVDFECTYINPTAARIVLGTPEYLTGKRLLEVLPGTKQASELFDRFVRVVETDQPHDIELEYNAEGISGWFRNMTVKLGDGVAVSFSDITQRKRVEALLRASRDELERLVDERTAKLRAANQQLHQEILEHQQTEQALRRSEQQFRQLFNEMLSGFALHDIICDAHGKPIDYRFLTVNPAFEAMTGLKSQDIIGRRVREILPQTEDYWIESYGRVALLGEPMQFENYSKALGKYFEVRAFCPAKGKFATLFHDITEHKRAEEDLRLDEARLEALLRFSTMIAASEKEITDFALEEGVRLTNSQIGYLHFINEDQLSLQLFTWSKEVYRQCYAEKNSHYPLEQAGVWVDCVRQRRSIIHNDYQNLPDKKGYPIGHIHLVRHLSVPVLDGDRVVAVAGVGNKTELYDETDARQLSLLMNGMWALLQRKRAELALQRLNAELEQRVKERTTEVQDLYNNAPCGYHSLDPDGLIVHINDTELRWLGYTAEELVGREHFSKLLTESSRRLFQQNYPLLKERGWVKDLEFEMIRKDGTILPVLLSETAVRDTAGNYVMSRSTLFDITARKQAEEALHRSRDELSAANAALAKAARLKDEFLANMSHELRTPLTAILNLAEALQEQVYGSLNDKQLKYLHTIEASGRHLLELINDILDLSKIEAGQLHLQMEKCAVGDVCQSSLQLIKEMAYKKRQQVFFAINPRSIDLYADVRCLKQMLFNLLGNAVKFTPEGGQIGLDVQGDTAVGIVRLSVWDTGIGIATADLPKLFRPFSQLDSGLARQYSGTGLGLSLVQRMADLHGGSLSVESVLGQGSHFTITLPWHVVAPTTFSLNQGDRSVTPPQPLTERPRGPGVREKPLILLVDDNETTLSIYADYLQLKGYQTIIARDGSEAVQMAQATTPDLILMDIQMPELDGLAATQRIRANPHQGIAATPIIALTALAMSGDRERCLAAGVDDYLSKPVNFQQLIQVIETQLAQSRESLCKP